MTVDGSSTVVEHTPHQPKVEVQVQVDAGTGGKKMLTNIEICNVVLFQHITTPGARGYGLDLNPRPWADEECSTTVLLALAPGQRKWWKKIKISSFCKVLHFAILQLCNFATLQLCNFAILQFCNAAPCSSGIDLVSNPPLWEDEASVLPLCYHCWPVIGY